MANRQLVVGLVGSVLPPRLQRSHLNTVWSRLRSAQLRIIMVTAEEAGKSLQGRLERPSLLKVSARNSCRFFLNFKCLAFTHSFVQRQRMSKSHVSGGFWLGGFSSVPAFRAELPNEITDMALEHRGEHWPVRWLIESTGFSGGWRWARMHAWRFVEDLGLPQGPPWQNMMFLWQL